MQTTQAKNAARARRIARVRAQVNGTAERPRLSVRRTLKHVYVQLVDDVAGRTLAAASDREVKAEKDAHKSGVAFLVGKLAAERVVAKGIKRAVFDRRDKRYHGRVKAVAEGARAGGLAF